MSTFLNPACLILALACAPLAAQDAPPAKAERIETGLRYHIRMKFRGTPDPMETRFTLVPTPAKTTRNRVQKPRLGGWRLEAERTHGLPYAQPMLLARAERLLYFSGPSPQTTLEPYAIRFGAQTCSVWKLEMPAGLKIHGYLVEVAPNLLALCDLSATFETGDVASIELHLEGFRLRSSTAPPEDGTALLSTLQQWSRKPPTGPGGAGADLLEQVR